MTRYEYTDGEPYDGPVIELADGRILTGPTFTENSRKLIKVEDDGGERSRELHKASPKEKAVQQGKGGSKGRKGGPVVSKKSPKASPTL